MSVKEIQKVSLNTINNKYNIRFALALTKDFSLVETLLGQINYAPLLQALNNEAGAYISIPNIFSHEGKIATGQETILICPKPNTRSVVSILDTLQRINDVTKNIQDTSLYTGVSNLVFDNTVRMEKIREITTWVEKTTDTLKEINAITLPREIDRQMAQILLGQEEERKDNILQKLKEIQTKLKSAYKQLTLLEQQSLWNLQ